MLLKCKLYCVKPSLKLAAISSNKDASNQGVSATIQFVRGHVFKDYFLAVSAVSSRGLQANDSKHSVT